MAKPRLEKVRALFYVLQHIQEGTSNFDTPSCLFYCVSPQKSALIRPQHGLMPHSPTPALNAAPSNASAANTNSPSSTKNPLKCRRNLPKNERFRRHSPHFSETEVMRKSPKNSSTTVRMAIVKNRKKSSKPSFPSVKICKICVRSSARMPL